jgi:hypothetical protein
MSAICTHAVEEPFNQLAGFPGREARGLHTNVSLGRPTFPQDPFHLGMKLVQGNDCTKSILPLAHTFTAHTELVCDDLPTLTFSKGLEKTSKFRPSIGFNKITGHAFAALRT